MQCYSTLNRYLQWEILLDIDSKYFGVQVDRGFRSPICGTKTEKSDVDTYGGRIHLYIFYRYDYLANVSFLDCQGQARVSVKCGYIWQDKFSISFTVIYLSYIFFHWHPLPLNKLRGVIKRAYFVYFITFKSIYLKSVHFGPKSKTIISHDWCDILRLYFTYLEIFHLFWMQEGVEICFNKLHSGFP